MASLLKSTKNTRPLMDNSMRYIRSDAIISLEDDEIQWLIENNILAVVDLRTAEEVEEKPCCLKEHMAFTYQNIPVSFANDFPDTPDMMPAYYLKMVDDTMNRIISTIENAKTNVIYFCRVGKDRTGVVSALLLFRQGVPHDYIISDYILSADNLKEVIEQDCHNNPNLNKEASTPSSEYMTQFLKLLETGAGGKH